MKSGIKSTLVGLIILLVILAAIGIGMKIRQKRAAELSRMPPPEPAPWALHVANATKGDLIRGFPTLAEVSASQEITLRAQVAGTVLKMGPREGVQVHSGEFLASIDVRELLENRASLEAQLKAAKAEVQRTKDEHHRQQDLKRKGLTSDEALQARRTAWVAAREKVNSLKRQISALDVRIGYGEVQAPVEAVVAARLTEPGDAVQPGTKLYRLNAESAARLKVTLPQEILSRVHPGTKIVIRHGKQERTIELDRIFPAVDARALGSAEADLDTLPFHLPSGSRIPAMAILKSARNALTVPHRALANAGTGKAWLFAVRDGKLHKIPVEVLLEGDKRVAIHGDLKPGESVVVAHRSVLLQLHDGDTVVVEPAA